MKKLYIHKAQGTAGIEVESLTIIIDQQMPEFESIQKTQGIFVVDGEDFVESICKVLPGGTLDRVLGKLHLKKSTSFVVPLFDEKQEKNMGNNQAFTDFEYTVILLYNKGVLDNTTLSEIMERYRGIDIDSGGMAGTISNDGHDVIEIVLKTFGIPLPESSEHYGEDKWDLFHKIKSDRFGWM